MKKLFLILMSCMVVFAFTAASVEAKPSRSYKSPSGSFKTTPTKPDTSNAKTDSGAATKSPSGTASTTTNTKPGFFSGGSFVKGMLVGGIAGLLFGSIFGNMGFLGNMLGLIVNVLAIVVVFSLIRAVVGMWVERRRARKRYQP